MREQVEARERQTLAPWAAFANQPALREVPVTLLDISIGWGDGHPHAARRPGVTAVVTVGATPRVITYSPLLICGEADDQMPLENAYLLREASGGHARLRVVPDAGHTVVRREGDGPEDKAHRWAILVFLAEALR